MMGRMMVRLLVLVCMMMGVCDAHARLVDPPSRASAWRFGWPTPADFNDNEGYCGGLYHQHHAQGGRCGICGDAWDKYPRPHEAGGKYATGTIVRRYREGQVIPARVDVTSNHRGHFEFRICPNNNPEVEASQTCLNQYPLYLADGSGFHYQVARHSGDHVVHLKLPSGLTCTQCVFQWRYVAGNNWGICEDGKGRKGCGPQEEFRACADVAIVSHPEGSSNGTESELWDSVTPTLPQPLHINNVPRDNKIPHAPSTIAVTPNKFLNSGFKNRVWKSLTKKPTAPFPTTTAPQKHSGSHRTSKSGPGTSPLVSQQTVRRCHAVGVWHQITTMDDWCSTNCHHVPSFCPPTHCACS